MARKPISFTGTRTTNGTVADFKAIMDPQNWEKNVPLIWKASRVVLGDVPPDRSEVPKTEHLTPSPNKSDWDDRTFYEVVTLPLVSEHHNLLKTSLTATENRIDFAYRQFECLSSVFLNEPAEGGIDVDQGGATCVQLLQVVGADPQVELTISKEVRFTQPTDMLPLVDLVSSVAVKMLLELLLLAVVAEPPGEKK